ncbi:Diguanylate cyclase YdeH [Anatilimnocola aggregata]|uniref:diguanylate cyclase n=1 Tax=Anatilimnocola aggregata TaxID=2528021 RepID=A0A517YHN4_9BACT|nr:GGDEF domain-containing protein [Anatilimnocola aggregata]QDU29722.1 Diguanylate cyclase YdeH [Anatilimnocola aggregata]
MILFVLSMAIMNIGLGYSLAVLLSDAPLISPTLVKRLLTVTSKAPKVEPAVETVPLTVADLPAIWHERLTAANLPPESFVEGLLLHLYLAATPYREQLLTAEVRGRHALSRLDQPAESQLLTDVRTLHHNWRTTLDEVLQIIRQFADRLLDETPIVSQLELLLEEQLTALDRLGHDLQQIDLAKEPELGARQILAQLAASVELLHRGRDGWQHLLGKQLRGGNQKTLPSQPLYLDSLTGQISRVGMESLFHLWWAEDPQRLRLVSCALVDIDRLARLNDRLGPRAGDRILAAAAELLCGGIRTDRGFDRLVRYSGQQFLLFFGDTGPRNAGSALERIRQSLEAVTLDYEGTELDLSISAGIAAIQRNDTLDLFLARLNRSLQDAKLHGRNRTSVDEGEGPQLIADPQYYPVRAKCVRIEQA